MMAMYANKNGTFFDETLLGHIKRGNNTEILSFLQDENPCHLSDSNGMTLLHFGAQVGNYELVQHLISLGADVDVQNHMKQTPLFFAVKNYREKTVRILIEANANIFLPDSTGQCAYVKCLNDISYDMQNITKLLLNRVTIEYLKEHMPAASDTFHVNCPLYYFMRVRNVEVTRFLLENGSLVSTKVTKPLNGDTALHLSAGLLEVENIKLLLEFGADVNAEGSNGETSLLRVPLYPNKSKALEAVEILIAAGAKMINRESRVNNAQMLLLKGNREIVRTVLQSGIDLLFEDRQGLTSLHYLASNFSKNIMQELLHLDFNINVRSREGLTMLHYAIPTNNISSIMFLLNHGADVHAKDDAYERSPLFSAINAERIKGVEILLEHGADPNVFTEKSIARVYAFSNNLIKDEMLEAMIPLFANLVSLEASGRAIEPFMRYQIESHPRFKNTFDSVKLQVEKMNEIRIANSVTLFDFLIVGNHKVIKFTRNKSLLSNLTNIVQEFNCPIPYYQRRLQQRYSKLFDLFKYRETIEEVVSEYCNLALPDIVEKIIEYLQDDT